ncbi:MAG: hypothetical protein LBE12_02700 [Planctomycetaceae bacterium]|jgi:hypothetical protein|nr:hypothetical protein [Planctomycetaceae bacterium]
MNTKNCFWVTACFVVALMSLVGNGYSDTLYRDSSSSRSDYTHYFQMIHDTSNNGWHNTETIKIINDDTDQNFRVFCVDYFTPITTEFKNPLIGQEYDAIALDSPSMMLYSQIQKDALNSLFSHVYSTIYDANGDIIDDVKSYLYQLVVWEIIHETDEAWNIAGGEFGIQNAATYRNPNDHSKGYIDTDFYNFAVSNINSWLDAIVGKITWDSIGYGEVTDNQLTVYVAEGGQNISQTFISVVAPIVPEPATILMFVIGMMSTLPLMRRTGKFFSHA